MASPSGSLVRNKLTLALVVFLTLLLLSILSMISAEPSVPPPSPPDAEAVSAAADALGQVRTVQAERNGTGQIRLDNRMLEGVSLLASDLADPKRLQIQADSQLLTGKISIPLGSRLWINASAEIEGRHEDFPKTRVTVGRITFPTFMSTWLLSLADMWLSAKEANLPPLGSMIRGMAVEDNVAVVDLRLPGQEGLIDGLMSARDAGLDRRLVGEIYCRLSDLQREYSVSNLSEYIRHAFKSAPTGGAEAYNKAALVALGYFVAGPEAEKALGELLYRRGCIAAASPIRLQGRRDLAKHWAASAALGAVLGDQPASMLGEWKELSDSVPSGSGFSFADLAADRSGMHYAKSAVDPATALRTAKRLRGITEDQLFPPSLRSAPEGLAQPQFEERFGSIEAARYREAVRRIDQELHGL